MNNTAKDKLVFDCNIFLQYMLNSDGPGGRCLKLALVGEVELFLSGPILIELRALPEKRVCRLRGINETRVDVSIRALLQCAEFKNDVPEVFRHPIDEDDSCYVNLAIAADANTIVSRDRHLLNLTNPAKPWSVGFRMKYPHIRIMPPEDYLKNHYEI